MGVRQVRASATEPWFEDTVAGLAAAQLEASGLPRRVGRCEAGLGAVGGRLARTQSRAVAEAVSTVLQQLVQVSHATDLCYLLTWSRG